MRKLTIVLAILLLTGCASFAGRTESETGAKTTGIWTSFGNTTGPSGLQGGGISLPGASMVSGALKAVSEATMALLGRAPIVIQHTESAKEVDPAE